MKFLLKRSGYPQVWAGPEQQLAAVCVDGAPRYFLSLEAGEQQLSEQAHLGTSEGQFFIHAYTCY